MTYFFRLLIGAVWVIFWPPAWWQKAWHSFIAAGALFAPDLRKLIDTQIIKLGIQTQDWHYYLLAAVLAIITLAFQISKLSTSQVQFSGFRKIEHNGAHYCMVTITNEAAVHLQLLAELRIFSLDDELVAVEGRDRFVLLTQQRLVERRKYQEKEVTRKRFNLGERETKDLEFAIISDDLEKLSVFDELGEIALPFGNYKFSITVTGGGAPINTVVEMRDQREASYVELINKLSIAEGEKKLFFNRAIKTTHPPSARR